MWVGVAMARLEGAVSGMSNEAGKGNRGELSGGTLCHSRYYCIHAHYLVRIVAGD